MFSWNLCELKKIYKKILNALGPSMIFQGLFRNCLVFFNWKSFFYSLKQKNEKFFIPNLDLNQWISTDSTTPAKTLAPLLPTWLVWRRVVGTVKKICGKYSSPDNSVHHCLSTALSVFLTTQRKQASRWRVVSWLRQHLLGLCQIERKVGSGAVLCVQLHWICIRIQNSCPIWIQI